VNEDKATRYHRLRRRTHLAGGLGGTAALAAFWLSSASARLRDLCEGVAGSVSGGAEALVAVGLYVAAFCLAAEVLAFPLAAYRGHVLERRYGLSPVTFTQWLVDHLKASALGIGLALVAATVAYAALRAFPIWWWVVTAFGLSAGSVVLAFAAPVLLFPLFFTFRRLERPPLVERLVSLAARAGAPVLGVYEWRLGERSRTANAALVGLAGTRRILVSDTLLEGYSEDEIEVILAHELAHHVHGDLWRALAVDAVLTLGALACAHVALLGVAGIGGVRAPSDVAGLPALLLAAGGWSLMTMPVVNTVSRAHERRADRFALDLTRNPDAFVSAMKRLGAQNLADEQPSRLTAWWFHTHPALPERLAAARAWLPSAAGARQAT
jgi:STE24 endopeptidase